MAGLYWIKIDNDLPIHPKAQALARRLEDPRAWSYMVLTWFWFSRFHADGGAPDDADTAAAIEGAAAWSGEPGKLVEHLVAVRVLDRADGRLLAHGWDEWQGAHIAKYQRDAERQREQRAAYRRSPQTGNRATVARPSNDPRTTVVSERRGEEKRGDQRGDDSPWHGPAEPPMTEEEKKREETQDFVNKALRRMRDPPTPEEPPLTPKEQEREETQRMVDETMRRATGGGTYTRRK